MHTLSNNRLNHLDAVRAIALILGVVFHASLSFMPFFIGWAVMDINTSHAVAIFALVSHSFRLEVFFLIAGFFAHLSFHRQGKADFISNRLLRIAVPFVLFWFLLKPLIDAGWIMGTNSYNGDLEILPSLTAAYSNFNNLPEGLFVGSHLWFLYYLLIATLGVLLIRTVFGLKNGLLEKISARFDSILGFLVTRKLALVLLLVPTVCCLWFMDHWGVDTPDRSLIPHVPALALYSLFFSLGWLLQRVPALLAKLARISWLKAGLTVLSIVSCLLLSPFESQYGHPFYAWLKLGFATSYSIMMWSLVFLLIGTCERLFSRPNAFVRYMADASYWMYLIHLPIVVFLQVLLADIELLWWVKLLLIVTTTISVSIVTYDAFVRSTLMGTLLNGKRKPRRLFRFNRHLEVIHESH